MRKKIGAREGSSPARQNRFANLDEFFRFVGRKADALEEAPLFRQQDVAAQIAIINFDSQCKTFPAAEDGRADFNGLNFICRHNKRVKDNP